MPQTFETLVSGTTTFGQLYGRINNLVEALRSAFSGTSFPTNPSPVAGQYCLRTDRLINGHPRIFIFTGNPALGENGWVEDAVASSIGQEVILARGTKPNLDQRLDVAMNEDGTLRAPASLNPSQWANLSGQTFAFVDATRFTVTGNQTDIYSATRRLKINHTTSIVYSEVVSSHFNSAQNRTTVTVLDAVISSTLVSVEHSLFSPRANNGAMSKEMLGIGIEHVQATAANTWRVIHNLNTPKVPMVSAYNETTEQVALSGYCGSGNFCGDGIRCGSGSIVNVPVMTDIAYSNLLISSRNRLYIRFATPQSGRAVVLI